MQIKPETIVAGFGIFLALWYLGASIYNRQRGITVYRWLHNGLGDLGGEISGRWIGSSGSGAELIVAGASAPFREIRVIYLLASRELLPLFLVDLLRGKRDRLIVKATLRANPGSELEIVREGGSLARQMRGVKDRPWEITEGPGGLVIGGCGTGLETLRAASLPFAQKYAAQVNQISWSKKAPHLIAILSLAGLVTKNGSAADLYADLAAAASAAQTSKS